ncbi:uncharacterized protein LOC131238838 [Magnolia sinica]|uniref:uncharacterized protein LOC131238838 n=1 Tax=Magnolia sinica TaxID=86752 RepID=UPI0026589C7E|nr:uncharacterized protein LOC131238838 [Magnolia sinica]
MLKPLTLGIYNLSGIMFVQAVLVLVVILIGWAYQAIQPPPPKFCGSPDGLPVTSPRIRIRDGRYLSYKERGVPKDTATYKIIIAHGFADSKDCVIPVSPELVEELGIYLLSFDRAGYGESDPNPKRSVKSEAFDIQDLADQLEIGSKFYVIGISMGAYSAWSCLKHIPHRLAGIGLIVPMVNYWWPSFPANLSGDGFRTLPEQDQWTLRIAHYAPSLLHWWMTQKWFPSLSLLKGHQGSYSHQDREILQNIASTPSVFQDKARQQGDYESLHRDLIVGLGKWGFDPMDLNNPFPHNKGSVHIWQGYEDKIIPVALQRYVSKRLPWIQYHELPDSGHLLAQANGVTDTILRALVLGEKSSITDFT